MRSLQCFSRVYIISYHIISSIESDCAALYDYKPVRLATDSDIFELFLSWGVMCPCIHPHDILYAYERMM